MSKKGRINEFTRKKDSEVYIAFRTVIKEAPPFTSILDISARAVNLPCSRFWISPDQAFKLISAISRRRTDINKFPAHRQEMLREIISRCNGDFSRANVERIVLSPAPRFYITPQTAFIYYYRHLKSLRQCKKK